MITSPLRRLKLEFRINQNYPLKNEATDGLKGNVDSDEDADLNEEEKINLESKIINYEFCKRKFIKK